MPEGTLLCTLENGNQRYYQRLPAKGNRKKERRYGIKTKPEVLNGLIRKKYAEDALRLIDKDLRAISMAVCKYVPIDEMSVMSAFIKKHPELSNRIYRKPINAEEWKNQISRIDNYHPESLKILLLTELGCALKANSILPRDWIIMESYTDRIVQPACPACIGLLISQY